MKHLLSIFALCVCTGLLPVQARAVDAPPVCLQGDVNDDGIINILDAIKIVGVALGLIDAEECALQADCDAEAPNPFGVCDCAGECDGAAALDECGVCNGNGIPAGDCDCDGTAVDCAGDCGGDAMADLCGTCDNDPSNDCPGDVDEDGFIGTEYGGDDCDDTNSAINPGASDWPCMDMNCNDMVDDGSYIDDCGDCVGGWSGLEPCGASPGFEVNIHVYRGSSQDDSTNLTFGMSPDATDGYDNETDVYAPPSPPGGFYAALSWDNERYHTQILELDSDTTQIEIALQFDGSPITLSWNNNDLASATTSCQLQDPIGVFLDVDMRNSSSVVISDPWITTLVIIFTASEN